jgi:hypothetical protein
MLSVLFDVKTKDSLCEEASQGAGNDASSAGNGYRAPLPCKEQSALSSAGNAIRILAFELAELRRSPNGFPAEEDWAMAELLNLCRS